MNNGFNFYFSLLLIWTLFFLPSLLAQMLLQIMSMLGSLSHKPASFSETLIPLCMHINGNTKQETITGLIVHLKVQADLLLLFAYPALCFDTLGKKYLKKNVIHKVSLSLQYDDGFAFSVLSSTQLYQRAAFTEEATSIIKGMCLSCPYRILWPD